MNSNTVSSMTDNQRILAITAYFHSIFHSNRNRNRKSSSSLLILPLGITAIISAYLRLFFAGSSILSPTEEQYLLQLLSDNGTLPSASTLLLRGSVHGFTAAKFHELCDGNSQTVTIIQTTTLHVFGGYTH